MTARKPKWLARREAIEKSLPHPGKLVVYETSGAACDLPIFHCAGRHRIKFDSYGQCPPNISRWKNKRNYGMCGSIGETNDIKVVAEAITQMNQMQRVGLCHREVIDRLKEHGFDVEQVDGGFR